MTLVVGCFTRTDCFLVTDRLITLQDRRGKFAGEHDDVSNKNVVCMADDGAFALGYTGSAYVNGVPTDKFIAECLYDERIPDGSFMGNRQRRIRGTVSNRLYALRRTCAENWRSGFIRVLVTGFRNYDRFRLPFIVQFELGQTSFGGEAMRLRFPMQQKFGLASVGAILDPDEIEKTFLASPLALQRYDPALIPAFLIALVRNKAAKDRTVGSDLMVIHIDGSHQRIDCRFLSDRAHVYNSMPLLDREGQSVAFTPWTISRRSFIAPSLMVGDHPMTTSNGIWEVRLFGAPAEPGKSIVLNVGQHRPPMPYS